MSAIEEFKKLMKQANEGNFEIEPEPIVEQIEESAEQPKISPLEELKNLLREAAPHYIPKEVVEENLEEEVKNLSSTEIIQMTADLLSPNINRSIAENIEAERWNDPLAQPNKEFVTLKQMNDHYNLFLGRIQQQMQSIGGSGEVNFRYLDDVNRARMTANNDNWVLEYDAATKKVQFTNEIGPIDNIRFDITHDARSHDHEVGSIHWDYLDQTLNIKHPGGVTQQVGQELYAFVRNSTANTVVNGTPVMFGGSEPDHGSGARLLVTPMIANGSFPSLYGLGIATHDLDSGQDGRITVWGKVRELNTSDWEVGDILYADPENDGQLTNAKPTAPNNVIPFAAVLKKDAVDGELFVRPTIEQQKYYGRFSRTTVQTASDINTAQAVQFNETNISKGVSFGGIDDTQILVDESGFYLFQVSAQITTTSIKGIVYFWFRKNGIDVIGSTRATTVTNGDTFSISTNISLPLLPDDYVEIMWGTNKAGIYLAALPATSFAPSTVSITLNVVQTQL